MLAVLVPPENLPVRGRATVVIRFTIFRDGAISGVEVETSSGQSLLDRAAGFLLGGARGCVIASLLLILYAFMPFSGTAKTQLDRSSLAPEAMSIIPAIIDTIMESVAPGSPPVMEKLERYLRTG